MDAVLTFSELGFSLTAVVVALTIAVLMSCYVKIVTVLGIVRFGLGADSLPSVLVTGGVALALSLVVMFPTMERAAAAMKNVLEKEASSGSISERVRVSALETGFEEWKKFIQRHTDPKIAQRFAEIALKLDTSTADLEKSASGMANQVESSRSVSSWRILAPAFLISEIKDAFAVGLSLLIPFLIVDLLVAHTLVAVGVERMDPAVVSFPFKLLLFVMADGWSLITGNLVASYL